MKKYMENPCLTQMTSDELIAVNGGGIFRKYGEYLGEKVGNILIAIGTAMILKRIV